MNLFIVIKYLKVKMEFSFENIIASKTQGNLTLQINALLEETYFSNPLVHWCG